MSPDPVPTPHLRKTPRQERARLMVERILEAAQGVLLEQGYERMTTNRIADAAGISPGSLYQYFPHKDAITAAVLDRYSRQISEQLAALVLPPGEQGPVPTLRATFSGLLDVLEANREFVRVVAEVLPRAQVGERAGDIERRVRDLVGAYLTFAPSTTRIAPTTSAWILVQMVEHLSVQYVLQSPGFPREQLVDELVRLTLAHLEPGT